MTSHACSVDRILLRCCLIFIYILQVASFAYYVLVILYYNVGQKFHIMPIFELYTNLGKEKIPASFLKETSVLLSKILVGKPEQYVMVHVLPDQLLVLGGSDKPCGYASLTSIGALGLEENKKHAAALYDHIHKNLGIEKDRFYINFNNRVKADIGYNGTTFDDLL